MKASDRGRNVRNKELFGCFDEIIISISPLGLSSVRVAVKEQGVCGVLPFGTQRGPKIEAQRTDSAGEVLGEGALLGGGGIIKGKQLQKSLSLAARGLHQPPWRARN